jgi:hypothetical protein
VLDFFAPLFVSRQKVERERLKAERMIAARRDPSFVGMTRARGIMMAFRHLAQFIDCCPEISSGQAVHHNDGLKTLLMANRLFI